MKDFDVKSFFKTVNGVFLGICIMGLIDLYKESSIEIKPIERVSIEKEVIEKRIKSPLSSDSFFLCRVTKVIDGDTVDVDLKIWEDITISKRIRFADIDTWESRGEQRDKGKAATIYLIGILEGQKIYLKTNGLTGKYGRTIGSLFIEVDGVKKSVSKMMIEAGHQKLILPVS